MKSSLQVMGFALLCAATSAWSAEPAVVQQNDVVFTGLFGAPRTVRSETLILPNANAVLRSQGARDRRVAQRETQSSAAVEQQRQSDARRKAEAEAMSGAVPAPADAASAEAAMLDASNPGASHPVVETSAETSEAVTAAPAAEPQSVEAPAPVPDAAPAVAPDEAPAADAAPAEAAATAAPAEAEAAAPEAAPAPEDEQPAAPAPGQ